MAQITLSRALRNDNPPSVDLFHHRWLGTETVLKYPGIGRGMHGLPSLRMLSKPVMVYLTGLLWDATNHNRRLRCIKGVVM